MNNKEYLDMLRDEIVERNALIHHPLMKMMYAGELTPEQVAGWARQFWVIPQGIAQLPYRPGNKSRRHLSSIRFEYPIQKSQRTF